MLIVNFKGSGEVCVEWRMYPEMALMYVPIEGMMGGWGLGGGRGTIRRVFWAFDRAVNVLVAVLQCRLV